MNCQRHNFALYVWTDHFDLEKRFVAIIHQVARFSAVDANNTKKQLTAEAQRHRRLALIYNGIHAALDV